MKNTLIILLFTVLLIQPVPAQNIDKNESTNIDLSSVDYFIKMAKKLSAGEDPTEEEWKELSETGGYNSGIASEFRRSLYPDLTKYAFSPKYEHEKDSVMSISYDDASNRKTFSKSTLENYLKVKDKLEELENFRNTYDFNSLEPLARKRLRSFLHNPVDSLIYFPPVYMRFFECDAQVIDGTFMVVDFNLFYSLGPEGRTNLLAHEMFHFYRSNFENNDFIESNPLMQQIDKLENEGIADLIDKGEGLEGGLDGMRLYSDSPVFLDSYSEKYKNTPGILRRLDSLTVSFVNKEMEEEEFESEIENYFIFGGHPNGHNMVGMITEAGLQDELLENYYSPFEFLRIYNKAAELENGYVFSEEFMSYMDSLEKELLESNKTFFPMKKKEKMLFAMVKNKGAKTALEYYQAEKTKDSAIKLFTESGMTNLGYDYLRNKDYESAIILFQMNAASYPDSWNAYDSLGEAYLATGNKDKAKENYEKSLELNPDNDNAKKILKTI